MTFEQTLEKYKNRGQEILDWMNEHPEISGNEKKTCEYLINILKEYGYKIISPRARQKYSFYATKEEKAGLKLPKIAIICEYDAMEDIGHGCGHSASCAASIICALALEDAYPDFPFQIDLIGTPDEEVSGGKIKMMEHGAFDEYEFAIVVQANSTNKPYFKTLASSDLLVNFYGKQAHASVNPWEGVNALNGVQLFFHALDMLKNSLESGDEVQGVILDGGKIPNVIPEKATGYVYLRAKSIVRLVELKKRVISCAQGCAMAVENSVDFSQSNPDFAEVFVGDTEKKIVCEVMEKLGLELSRDEESRASSDIGNLDTIIPVLNPMISTKKPEIKLYSREFAKLMKTESGTEVMMTGAKVMAKIIEKLAFEPKVLERLKEEHFLYRNNKA
jgi:amidohydrolase